MKQFVFAGLLVVATAVLGAAQYPPPHPRLLLTASQVPEVIARTAMTGTPMANAYASMVTAVTVTLPANPQDWVFQRELRRMQEVALRYRLTGNSAYATNAKAALLTAVNGVAPTGNVGPYQLATYPCAMAITFDLIHDALSTSERATVVAKLEQWVNALSVGSSAVGGYGAYASATDNYSFAWSGGIVMCLLAIWGESSRPGILADIHANMLRLQDGWMDAVSPDGSVDESYGYANYGVLWSVRSAIACVNSGLTDYLDGTNVIKTPEWLGASLMGAEFPWIGDSSPSHKGLDLDPILYHLAERSNAPAALAGLLRIYGIRSVSDSSVVWAFSPYITVLLRYPAQLIPERAEIGSRFFRDNRNEAPAPLNKLANFPGVGLGGHAFLHNDIVATDAPLSILYNIRDEWMNHGHEDDGHLVMGVGGFNQYVDRGYAGNDAAQSQAHNIVVVSGATGFGGNANNYYAPPEPDGRYFGEKKAATFARGFDYVRGDHHVAWQMARAERTVALIKDDQQPYAIVIDIVDQDGASHTYDELFYGASQASGSGTVASPMAVTKLGKTLRAVWLSPTNVSVLPGTPVSGGGITAYGNKVRAVGQEVVFTSLHGAVAPTLVAPLLSPSSTTRGGIATFFAHQDRILVSASGFGISDAETQGDGRLAWIREAAGAVTEWCLAEGQVLVHGGAPLLAANAMVTVSVRRGDVELFILDGTAVEDLVATLHVPFVPSRVRVNGEETAFATNGATITLGTTTTPSTRDRVYTFADGDFQDALPSPGLTITSGEQLVSDSGWSGLTLCGGQSNPARPVSLGITLTFDPGIVGTRAIVKMGSQPTVGDLLTLQLGQSLAGELQAAVFDLPSATLPVATFVVPTSPIPGRSRLMLELDPTTGQLSLYSPTAYVGSASLIPRTTPFFTRVTLGEFVAVDDIAYFDSEENGIDVQGLVLWTSSSSGRAGFAVHTPALSAYSTLELAVGAMPLTPALTTTWMVLTGMAPTNLLAYPFGGAPLLRELTFESTAAAVAPGATPPLTLTLSGSGAAVPLIGTATVN